MAPLLLFLLAVTVGKTATVVSDPVNGAVTPKAIPGAVVEYSITVTNATLTALDSGKVQIADAVPTGAKLYVGDLGGGTGPVVCSQGLVPSGLSTTYTSLNSTTDDLEFSKDSGTTYTYSPTADSSGYDAAVTNLRVKTRGSAAVGGSYIVKYRVAVK